MATTENIASFLTDWDAAMLAYDVAHGTNGVADMLGAGFDMNSTNSAGLWTVVGAAVPDLTPNSHVPVFWTDGTDTIGPLSFDDLSNAGKVAAVLDGYFGSSFKMWRILTHVAAALTTAGATITGIGAGPWTFANYQAFFEDLEGRASVCSDPQGLELPGTMG